MIQSWWHFEDKVNPSDGRIVRQVSDFYTNEQFISFSIPSYFVKCKVKSRYKGNELEFIQNGSKFIINLGNLQEWPICDEYVYLRHIKIEIEYVDIRPDFDRLEYGYWILKTGYDSTIGIDNITMPEFSLTVPLGMKIVNKGLDNVKLLMDYKLDLLYEQKY